MTVKKMKIYIKNNNPRKNKNFKRTKLMNNLSKLLKQKIK